MTFSSSHSNSAKQVPYPQFQTQKPYSVAPLFEKISQFPGQD